MAVKNILVDDIDGESQPAVTVPFAIRGKRYEIDLSRKSESEFDKALKPFISNARVVGGASKPQKKTVSAPKKTAAAKNGTGRNMEEVRQWAKDTGRTIAKRGRVSADVLAEFDEYKKSQKTSDDAQKATAATN